MSVLDSTTSSNGVTSAEGFRRRAGIALSHQRCADSVAIRILGLRCTWWHWRQANDAIASERSILSENHDVKVFTCRGEPVRTYIFGGLDARGGRNYGQTDRQTDRQTHARTHAGTNTHTYAHTHTRDNYSNPRCACPRRLIIINFLCNKNSCDSI